MKTTLTFLLLFTVSSLYAQETCLEKLNRANQLYSSGKIAEAKSITHRCLAESTDVTERWQALRLATLIALLQNNNDSARIFAEEMMELNPTYRPTVHKDPAELISLIRSVTVLPRLSLGLALSLGGNITIPEVMNTYVTGAYKKEYTNAEGFQFGLLTGYQINRRVGVHAGLMFSTKKYEIAYAYNGLSMQLEEDLTYFDIPLTARYSLLPSRRLNPFLIGGFTASILNRSQTDFRRITLSDNSEYLAENMDSRPRRNNAAYGLVTGIGAAWKLSNGHFAVKINYNRSFSNITDSDQRYSEPNNIINYYYLDDDIRLHSLAFTLEYTLYLNYRVLKKKRTP